MIDSLDIGLGTTRKFYQEEDVKQKLNDFLQELKESFKCSEVNECEDYEEAYELLANHVTYLKVEIDKLALKHFGTQLVGTQSIEGVKDD